ncbi:hypothetical protein FYK55_27850 [Roseiconus nitratireducens]|uniref:Uncharacterized protein n=1 Tax=Roseiconus nitratireducens TaxID=2605748 RepID=A0A5M6CS23_9BACT|nr:hypothetical protein [Roseiconus nitratireducens]KAA5537994.1 hypothetical protein FYK55_27850 [Roseiconus nitratireducens]
MARAIGSVAAAFFFGSLIGYFLLSRFVGLIAQPVWVPTSPAVIGTLCGAVFAIFTACHQMRRLARQREIEALAGSSGWKYSPKGSDWVVDKIKQLTGYRGAWWLENELHMRIDDVGMTVGDLYHRTSGQETSQTTKRTAAHFQSEHFNFPHFTLQREGKLLTFVSDLIGVKDIDFSGAPDFSQAYHLSSDDPEATRQLFTKDCLDFFADDHGWEIRAERDQLLIARDNLIDPKDHLAFIEKAKSILALFLKSQEQQVKSAPDHPAPGSTIPPVATEPRGASTAKHPLTTGLKESRVQTEASGHEDQSWLARRIEANTADWTEIEHFLRSPPPREVPAAIRRQRAGTNGVLLIGFLGVVGMIVLVLFLLGVVQADKIGFWWAVVTGMILISITILISVLVHTRQKNIRILRTGRLHSAEIVEVRHTGWEVNSQPQFAVSYRYHAAGQTRMKHCKLYGAHGELAREVKESGEETPVLIDPESPDHCVLGIQLTNPFRVRL